MLHKETVSRTLWDSLQKLMHLKELNNFRLVEGTSLSLQLGHRISIDIDLFTDCSYDSIDFTAIDSILKIEFPIVDTVSFEKNSIGKSYFVGLSPNDLVKLDFFYTDPFIFPELYADGIRLAMKEEIAAMKLEVICHAGRKKDFWDIHELLENYSLSEMIQFYEKRYPYGFSKNEILFKLGSFGRADNDIDPICLRQKHWELIKIDLEENLKIEFNKN